MDDAVRRKILAQREEWVTSGRFRFLLQRPAEHAVARLKRKHPDAVDFVHALVRAAVVGWDGVDAAALYAGGGDAPIPFDPETFMVWVEDQPDVYADVQAGVVGALMAHKERREAAGKN